MPVSSVSYCFQNCRRKHINSWYFALSYDRTSATELANTMDFGNAPERNHRIFFTSRGTTPFPPEESSGTLINSFMHIIIGRKFLICLLLLLVFWPCCCTVSVSACVCIGVQLDHDQQYFSTRHYHTPHPWQPHCLTTDDGAYQQ